MTHDFDPVFCGEDVHGAFGLSYASYLVARRSLMQEMSADWQHRLVTLMDEFNEAFPSGGGVFAVFLRGENGKFESDALRNYRYPDRAAIEEARQW